MKDEDRSSTVSPQPLSFALSLADGTRLALRAGDEEAARVVDWLARTAQLPPASSPLPPGARRLLAVTTRSGDLSPQVDDADVVYVLDALRLLHSLRSPGGRQSRGRRTVSSVAPDPNTERQRLWQQLMRLSACIAHETQPRGGVLLHSGLAAYPHRQPTFPLQGVSQPGRWESAPSPQEGEGRGEEGILLAGRSGVGKTTASARLPRPWRALADDMVLVVRAEDGAYWAHPWPTWSRFFGDEAGDGNGTWDTQGAVPLRAIFVLEQGDEDRVAPLGPGHAVSLLAELARQTSTYFVRGWPLDELAAFNRQCFENLCALARAVPAYSLHVSLDGAFWEEIARALG